MQMDRKLGETMPRRTTVSRSVGSVARGVAPPSMARGSASRADGQNRFAALDPETVDAEPLVEINFGSSGSTSDTCSMDLFSCLGPPLSTFVRHEGCVPQGFCESGGPLAHVYAVILVVVHPGVVRLGA